MDKFIDQTEIVIGIIQERMSDESFKKSSEASRRMYEYVRNETEKSQLNTHELLNAVGTIFLATLQLAMHVAEKEQE